MSGGVGEAEAWENWRRLFRRKRASDFVGAEGSRARSRSRGAGGTLRFAVSGAGRPFAEEMKERALPNRSAGLVYAVADAGVRVRASCGFPSEVPAC